MEFPPSKQSLQMLGVSLLACFAISAVPVSGSTWNDSHPLEWGFGEDAYPISGGSLNAWQDGDDPEEVPDEKEGDKEEGDKEKDDKKDPDKKDPDEKEEDPENDDSEEEDSEEEDSDEEESDDADSDDDESSDETDEDDEEEEEILPLTIETLTSVDWKKGKSLPDSVTKYDGKKVRISGYMATGTELDASEFELVPQNCECGRSKVNHFVKVIIEDGGAEFDPARVQFVGRLEISEEEEDGFVTSLYRLTIESFEPETPDDDTAPAPFVR